MSQEGYASVQPANCSISPEMAMLVARVPIYYKLEHRNAIAPSKGRDSDMGYDIHVVEDSTWTNKSEFMLLAGQRHTFSTGIKVETPEEYGFLLRDRSGLAVKSGLHVLAGVIEGTYRGEWKICVVNLGDWPIFIRPKDKIAQAILTKIIPSDIIEKEGDLSETDRGEKGFGSSGR